MASGCRPPGRSNLYHEGGELNRCVNPSGPSLSAGETFPTEDERHALNC